MKERFYKVCDVIITAFRKAGNNRYKLEIDSDCIEFLSYYCDENNGRCEVSTIMRCYLRANGRLNYYIMFLEGEQVSDDCTKAEWFETLKRYIPIEVTDDER